MIMQKDFYKYPTTIKTEHFVFERKTNGVYVEYMAERNDAQEQSQYLRIDESEGIIETSHWQKDNFDCAKKELSATLKLYFTKF